MKYPPKKILVPVDFSGYSEKALRTAAEMAHIHGAELVIFHVVKDPVQEVAYAGAGAMGTVGTATVPPVAMDEWKGLREETWHEAQKIMDEFKGRIPDVKLVRTELKWSTRVSDDIVEFANQAGCDLIVMATMGRSGMKRLLMGSVTESVLRSTNIPAMVLPPDEEEDEKGPTEN